jgi:hypothetical protein
LAHGDREDVMRRAISGVAVAVLGLGALAGASAASAASAAPFTPPPGFTIDLTTASTTGPTHYAECFVARRRLQCGNVGRLPQGASCRFGEAVPYWVLARKGRARTTYFCVDEGYHGWPRLRERRSWRSGGFRCRHRVLGKGDATYGQLLCRAPSGHGFAVTATNRPVRLAP